MRFVEGFAAPDDGLHSGTAILPLTKPSKRMPSAKQRPTSSAVDPTTRCLSLSTSIISTSYQPVFASSFATHSMSASYNPASSNFPQDDAFQIRTFPLPRQN
jgi:hypothetical protein